MINILFCTVEPNNSIANERETMTLLMVPYISVGNVYTKKEIMNAKESVCLIQISLDLHIKL